MKNTIGAIAVILMLIFAIWTFASYIHSVEKRLKVLEVRSSKTVEIFVERAFDEDMRVYDYRLIGVKEN